MLLLVSFTREIRDFKDIDVVIARGPVGRGKRTLLTAGEQSAARMARGEDVENNEHSQFQSLVQYAMLGWAVGSFVVCARTERYGERANPPTGRSQNRHGLLMV
jgi:hypothetical protein